MKRILTLALALALGLLCILPACAETIEEIRAELGSCSIEDYTGVIWDPFDWEEPTPFRAVERKQADNGRVVWNVDWGPSDSGYLEIWLAHWFPSRGIVADAWYDLDSDGALEWIALVTRDGSEEERSVENGAFLWLCVYELEGEDAHLADECCISMSWDCFSSFTRVSLTELSDGTPVVLTEDYYGVDDHLMTLWDLAYDGSALRISGGIAFQPWVCGGAIYLFGEGTSMDMLPRAREYIGESDLLDGAILPEAEGDPIPASLLDHMSTEDDDNGLIEAFKRYVAALELTMDADGDWQDGAFEYEAVPASGDELLLLCASKFNPDDDGHPYMRIERAVDAHPASATATGDCNLRAEPNLDAPVLGLILGGTQVEYLGEESVDKRGVAWYRVRYKGREGWASSRYVQLS